MPPNLGRIPIQTLTCGAVIIGSAVVSGAIAAVTAPAAAIGVGTAAVLTGLVGSLSGLAGEVAGNDLAEFAQRFRPSAEVLRNHDLTKAGGMAIAVVIKHAATNPEFHNDKPKLEKLAQKAVKYYPTIAEEDLANVFVGIQEEQLPAIFSSTAEEFSQVKALDPQSWELLLDWLKGKEELVILPNSVIRHIADELYDTFPQALREVLKENVARDGKAFSGMMLLLLGEIAADLRDLRTELNQKCDRILEEVQRLKAMPTEAPEVTQVFQQLLAQVQSGLSQELKVIAQQLTNELREAEQRIIEHQTQGFTQLHEKIEDVSKQVQQIAERDSRPITVSGIIDSTRPSLNNWQGRREEIEQIQGWLDAQNINLIGIVAAGGYGKSTLAAKIYEESPDFTDKFWVNVSQPINFNLWGRELLKLLGYEADERVSDSQLAGELVTHLRDDGQYLLVIDNLESLLQSDGQWRDAAYKEFFNRWLSYGDRSVILVTTQEKPDLPEQNARWRRLDGLKPSEGAALLKEQGIQGSETELLDFAEQVEGHPLLLNLVIGFLRAEEGDNPPLSALRREDINLFEVIGLHRGQPNISVGKVFDASFERLDDRFKTLLLNVSVYRLPFNAAAAAVMLPEVGEGRQDVDIRQVEQDLRLLVRRSLLQEQRDATEERRFRFQPLILEYVKQKAGDRTEAHQQAIAYYRKNVKLRKDWQTKDDVTEYLEIFHHYCKLKDYNQAFKTIYDCDNFLNLRGYNIIRVQLYSQLVQEWEPNNPEEQGQFNTALTSLGNAYYFLGQYHEALKFCQQSLEISQEIGDRRGEAISLVGLGNAYYFLGQYHEALKFYQQSLEISREIGDRRGEAISLGNLGNAYQSLGQYQRAIEFYQQSLEISQEIGDRQGEASSLGNLGNAYNFLGQCQRAIEFHQQSLEISQEIGNRQGEASSLINLGNAYNSLGQYQRAIEFLQQSLEISREIGDRQGEASSLGNLGNAYQSLGQYQRAIEFLQQWLEISREIGDRQGEASSLINLGNAYNSLGQYQRAIEFLQQSLEIFWEIGDRQGEARSLGNLGNAYDSLGQYQRAIEFHQQWLEISREIGDRQGEARSLGGLGNAYQSLGQYQQAIEFHQQWLEISWEIGDRQGEANSLGGLGNACNSLGRYQEAINFYQQWLKIAQQIDDRRGEAAAWFNLGIVLTKLDRKSQAITDYRKARELYLAMGLDGDVQGCNNAIQRLSKRSNPLVALLKAVTKSLLHLWRLVRGQFRW